MRKDLAWSRRKLAKDPLGGMNVAVVGGTNAIGRALAPAIAAGEATALVVGRRDHRELAYLPNRR
jgi:NAD(P)-dependent dehydrogenase (short-subunit alcohol dehydrogenase family)